MAKVIIGIHGLGNKPPGELLKLWWKQSMIEGLRENKLDPEFPKFEMVYWADILNSKPLNPDEKDKDSPYYLDEPYIKAPEEFEIENHRTRKKIIDFIGKQINKIFLNEDLSLNYSSLTDAILSRYFKDLDIYFTQNCTQENASHCKARDLINQRLIQVLEKYKKDEIMIVSHSMGSIIAFEVLSFHAKNLNINSLVTIGSPLGLPVVISKIAAEQNEKLNGQSHLATPPTIRHYWYNFSDIMDYVSFNYKLADDFGANKWGIRPIDFLVTNNYKINGKGNPHKSYGYLRTAEFAKILYEFSLSEKLSIHQRIRRIVNRLFHQFKS